MDIDASLGMKKSYVPVDGGGCVYGLVLEAVLEPHGAPLPDWSIHQRINKHLPFFENVPSKAMSSEVSVR